MLPGVFASNLTGNQLIGRRPGRSSPRGTMPVVPRLNLERESLKCPHCSMMVVAMWSEQRLGHEGRHLCTFQHASCPACERFILRLVRVPMPTDEELDPRPEFVTLYPRVARRDPIPHNVPITLAEDFHEAAAVLGESPKASAALSRRCLQNLLLEKAGATKRDLYDQIQEVIDARILPSQLAEDLDVVRAIGNFAAHPIKNQSTGQIVEVEPGEAEWTLDVLDALFDFFFVQAERRQQRRAALNDKLKDAGRKPLR